MQEKILKSDTLYKWMKEHRTQFVSHAIWACNVDSLLASGLVRPAESILRCPPYLVEYEKENYNSRGVLDLSADIKTLSMANVKIPTRIKIISSTPLEYLATPNRLILNQEEYSLLEINYKKGNNILKLKNGKSYTFEFSQEFETLMIQDFPDIDYDYIDIEEALSTVKNTVHRSYGRLQIIQDIIEGNIFDKKLAEIWNLYAELVEKENMANIAYEIYKARETQFNEDTKLNTDVRCCYNKILWSYGDVVVLKGQPDKIISSIVNLKPIGRQKYSNEPLVDGQEVSLLQPWENNGEFFSLDLSNENTIVIGPEKSLLSYHNKNYQLFSFEEMTLSQLEFFKVPERLRPKPETPAFFPASNSNVSNPNSFEIESLKTLTSQIRIGVL